MELIRIEKDPERAKSLLVLTTLRLSKISNFDMEKESSLLAESYYEICKELITALLFLDGYKTLSHKDLVEYIKLNYNEKFTENEITILDTLRKRRNNIVYYGIFVDPSYIKRNKVIFENIIRKLKNIVENKLAPQQ